MFRLLTRTLANAAPNANAGVTFANQILTEYRPSQLAEYLEACWGQQRDGNRQLALGNAQDLQAAAHRAMARPSDSLLDPLAPLANDPPLITDVVTWPHAVYSALLEQTRIVPIFRRVIFEWTHGERLPRASQRSQQWLHATEQLFFGPRFYSVRATTSTIRPDDAAVRRNLYWRLFAWDIPADPDNQRSCSFVKAEAANRDFSSLFEALLSEVWRGIANALNLIGPNDTDNNAIDTLIRRLREMLMSRRFAGALSREEFDAVTMMSWLHLTVEYQTEIVRDLNAQAVGLADRLKLIGQRVGLPAHTRSDAYFQLADPMSEILIRIESDSVGGAQNLYNMGANGLGQVMLQIITHWSIATGRNVKDQTIRPPLGTVLTQAARSSDVPLAQRGLAPVAR